MTKMTSIPEYMMPAFQGIIPSVIGSCSVDGTPNVTYLSQVFYVDEHHVALSRQFFNKTVRNIMENPVVNIIIMCAVTAKIYKLLLDFVESQTEGEVFENMDLQLQVIAGMQGMSDVFKLQSADIFKVRTIEILYAI